MKLMFGVGECRKQKQIFRHFSFSASFLQSLRASAETGSHCVPLSWAFCSLFERTEK